MISINRESSQKIHQNASSIDKNSSQVENYYSTAS